jgi:hypothetical protein
MDHLSFTSSIAARWVKTARRDRVVPDSGGAAFPVSGRLWASGVNVGSLVVTPQRGCSIYKIEGGSLQIALRLQVLGHERLREDHRPVLAS